jgi:hypothetical protein
MHSALGYQATAAFAAKILARAVVIASKDPMHMPEQKIKQADQHGQAAMKMILVIRERRFFTKPENVNIFLEDPDFKSLQNRKDFQALVGMLKKVTSDRIAC